MAQIWEHDGGDLHKRKASESPSPPVEVISKRARMELGDESTARERNGTMDMGMDVNMIGHDDTHIRSGDAEKNSLDARNTDNGSLPWPDAPMRDDDARADGNSPGRDGPQSYATHRWSDVNARKNITLEERKRGKRLFGRLLNTLGGGNRRSKTGEQEQSQHRLEMERRQQERIEQRRADEDRRRRERRAEILAERRVAQVKFDEQVMETRHANLLQRAHSLRTKNEPWIYYKPWEPTRQQARIINEQISDAKHTIEKETQEFQLRKEQRLAELRNRPPITTAEKQQPDTYSSSVDEQTLANPPQDTETPDPDPAMGPSPSAPAKPESAKAMAQQAFKQQQPDENADEMQEENMEDAVLY